MLLGFISLLLVVFQGVIQEICVPESWQRHMTPCKRGDESSPSVTKRYAAAFFSGVGGGGRRLLSGGSEEGSDHCKRKGKVPLLSLEAIHSLHIFIFALAVTHVVLSVLTMLFGVAKVRQWKPWEDAIQKDVKESDPNKITHLHQSEFIRDRFHGVEDVSMIMGWLHSFFKQFYGSVSKSDYSAMRLGFIQTHCKGNPKFDFHRYMLRALEADFKKVVGISWYLWIFVVIFLLLNVNGWHAYFWISFVPLVILLVVGAKLEHIISQLAHEIAEKHSAIEGDVAVKPSDDHFWFHRPRIVLFLIHFILFQNAFEIAFFFWILTTFTFDSCIMGQVGYVIPRLVMSVITQFLCSYSTLPLYAVVAQMGSSFKEVIFEEHVKASIVGWRQNAKKRKARRVMSTEESRSEAIESAGESLRNVLSQARSDSLMEEGEADRIEEVAQRARAHVLQVL
ncbi:uncharacterized protein A4U43_UnF2460 [Asparagus officinalis]|uniref:MLO-like protein n=1 Tax=Asparagus officinalis TaxID=4686 RepID=A0A1R3L790_ASPOF|nr:MLO-like protein 1 [Asparagus officinalis]ONK55497.1 uncharacterized protein A4U43_UnF2460 [Asparagus officinalis]